MKRRLTAPSLSKLPNEMLGAILEFVEDRGAVCSVSSLWCATALRVSKISDVITQYEHKPVYSDIDMILTDNTSPYNDLHKCKREVAKPCIYHACAGGNRVVIRHVAHQSNACQHENCLAMCNASVVTDYKICLIIACARAPTYIIRQLDAFLFDGDSAERTRVLHEGIKQACYHGNLSVIRYIINNIPSSHHDLVMQAAQYAYANLLVLWYIFKRVSPDAVRIDLILPIVRQMGCHGFIDGFTWLKNKFKNQKQFHEQLDSAFWIACSMTDIAPKLLIQIPQHCSLVVMLAATYTDNLELFKYLMHNHQIDMFLDHAIAVNSMQIAEYILTHV